MREPLALCAMLVALVAVPAHGGMIYVQAVAGPSGNTVRTSDGDTSAWTNSPTNVPGTRNDYDYLWGLPPADQANTIAGVTTGGKMTGLNQDQFLAWESNGQNTELCDGITTSVHGLALGSYNVYVLWQTTGTWDIQAKLSSAATFTTYNAGTDVSTNGYGQILRQGLVGTTNNVTSFSVDVDDTPPISSPRSRYVGVAYEAVPEPSGLFTLLAGALVTLVGRQWRRD